MNLKSGNWCWVKQCKPRGFLWKRGSNERHFVVLIRESSWVTLDGGGGSYSWCLKLSAMFALQEIDCLICVETSPFFAKKWGSQAVNFHGFRVLWGVELNWKLEGSIPKDCHERLGVVTTMELFLFAKWRLPLRVFGANVLRSLWPFLNLHP